MDDFLGDVLAIIFVIFAIRFIVKMIKKSDDKRAEAARHPRTDAQKELVREVIAAIERDAPDFYEAHVFPSNSGGNYSGFVFYSPNQYCIPGWEHLGSIGHEGYYYYFSDHGYFVSKGMAYTLACQIADHFGGACYEGGTTSFYVAGSRRIASDLEQKRQEELERQRIKNLKHL